MFSVTIYIFFFILTQIIAEIEIIDQGIEYIENDDIAIVFYITVKNICKDDLEIAVNMIQCCETIYQDEEVDCASMTLIGGDMGLLPSTYVKNLTLIYPNIYLFNRRGICSIEVIYRNQLKKKEVNVDIHFDTTKSCPETEKRKTGKCDTVDLDPKQNCNPVDCLIKYSGGISYFNPECKRCQKVPICNSKTEGCFPDIAYSPYNNQCGDLNIPISKNDLENIESGQSNAGKPLTMINAICHYGKVTQNGECLCHVGWTTATSDEGMYEPGVAQHHLCNIQVGDWNCLNKNRIKITAILIGLFAITVISKVLLLMCLMTWCYRHYRKPETICSKDIDPNDNSILICENQESFDKCLCCQLDEESTGYQRQKTLQSQTVNISYFPCSPSAFSSIKTSTGTTSKTKTDVSIELSNSSTSAAISFPDGESSEDSDDSLLGEDEGSNNIAYGVYCGMENNDLEVHDDDDDDDDDDNEDDDDEDDKGESGSKRAETDSGKDVIQNVP